MKYVITAPPGGLAHFLSRVIANEYNFEVSSNGSYHGLSKKYSSKTSELENFENMLTDTDEDVVCLHNFDNRDLSTVFVGRTVVNIIVDSCFEIYFNNYYRKAIQSSRSVENKFLLDSQLRFPTSNNYLREEFFFVYNAATQGQIDWLPTDMHGINVSFSDFYSLPKFTAVLSKIPGVDTPQHQIQRIWDHFIASQQPILDRVNRYQHICDQLMAQQPVTIPPEFDNIDFGIMCGMIYSQYGVDKLNLQSDVWI